MSELVGNPKDRFSQVTAHFVGGLPPGLQPIHKSSIVMFLERVYGIEEQATFFRLLEDCFLADLRAATTLDMVNVQIMLFSVLLLDEDLDQVLLKM